MRRFLSLFMVVLLALRGLAGDAMAMELSGQPLHAGHAQVHARALDEMVAMAHSLHHAPADPLTDARPSGHHDMGPHHGAVPNTAAVCSADAGNSDCHQHEGHCTACGICHSTLANPQFTALSPGEMRAELSIHGTERFASAAPAELVKPPISAL
ncbi:hypothetical protein [Comamonas guangdongensis]|uniref:CopL family metal-binding regulatory protein n=1 Tax=Comamonas guangdongensis TaxID=510515 RepID=A0ABV3ZXI5_9BURK